MSKVVSRVLAGVGMVIAVALGGALPAMAAEPKPTGGGGASTAAASTDVTQALVVGGLAFVLMIGAAAAVLWFTVKHRDQSR
ncbi:hypothetical protein [Amycolatopsis nigrescens]|uniref:hypothetical protein n=1 Tax=Amycolatopsis nigrescens TaxID=381445 RepID=UPI00037FAA2F|nr:hypothetical protein [Amycolatopsis nigrescens]